MHLFISATHIMKKDTLRNETWSLRQNKLESLRVFNLGLLISNMYHMLE